VKTALVLSAGGLFGAYQVGAWKQISRVFQPDLIIGASIGALNGWHIAGGCARELEALWLDPAMGSIIRLKPDGNLLKGYFDHEPLLDEIRKFYGRCRPVTPYWLVVVEVPSFRTRLISADEVIPEHLLASCSIYRFFPNVRIGGREYTDGGLLGHLPLWAAAQQGATKIVAIDCLGRIKPWWMQATMSSLHVLGPKRRLPKDVTVLRPTRTLGDAKLGMTYDAARIREWMDLGESDARQAFPITM